MKGYIQKAETLIEALPYIREFTGKTVVVKYGGAAMSGDERMASFAEDIVLLQFVGICPVVVHGGGAQIDRLLAALHISSFWESGLLVRSDEAFEFFVMEHVGSVNKKITGLVFLFGGK